MNLKPRIVTFWGKKRKITPVLLDKKFGDGKKLIYLSTMNSRPDYYLVRVDSKTDSVSDNDDFENLLDEIFEEIRDKYGPYDDDEEIIFPALDTEGGYNWDEVDEDDEDRIEIEEILKKRGGK
jgi:hypothetical protein